MALLKECDALGPLLYKHATPNGVKTARSTKYETESTNNYFVATGAAMYQTLSNGSFIQAFRSP
jgi:hypothetical protein